MLKGGSDAGAGVRNELRLAGAAAGGNCKRGGVLCRARSPQASLVRSAVAWQLIGPTPPTLEAICWPVRVGSLGGEAAQGGRPTQRLRIGLWTTAE